ncbi:MAG: hypothetical protein HY607_04405 [Planctomycetes bacterium]|nr:hypothetical protein [Planctomycetota bacterium]
MKLPDFWDFLMEGGEIHPIRYSVTDGLTCEKNGSFYCNLMLDICYLRGEDHQLYY